MVRRMLVVTTGLALLLLSGCAGGDGESDAEPSATASSAPTSAAPPRAYTVEDLAAALPRSSQLPVAGQKKDACPGGDTCEDVAASVGFGLDLPVPAAEREKLANAAFVSDYLNVTARTFADEAAAKASVTEVRADDQKYEGSFDIPLKELPENRYNPGETGTGSVVDDELDGWTGYMVSRVQKYSSTDETNDKPFQVSKLLVSRGVTRLSVLVVMLSEPRDEGEATKVAQQVAAEYLERLG